MREIFSANWVLSLGNLVVATLDTTPPGNRGGTDGVGGREEGGNLINSPFPAAAGPGIVLLFTFRKISRRIRMAGFYCLHTETPDYLTRILTLDEFNNISDKLSSFHDWAL